jgi:hypothetical protein
MCEGPARRPLAVSGVEHQPESRLGPRALAFEIPVAERARLAEEIGAHVRVRLPSVGSSP